MTDHGDEAASRGTGIRRRFEALGISEREWHERTGIDRKTLHRAMEDRPGTRPSTYDAIEANLDRLAPRNVEPSDEYVEFSLRGGRVVVKGSVRDIDALREAVTRLDNDLRRDDQAG